MYEWCREYYDIFVVVFTVGSAIPLTIQSIAIWSKKSGESVSVIWFSYTFFLAACNYLYGIGAEDTLIQVNGMVRAFVHIPILIGLLVNKEITKTEIIVFILLFFYILVMLQFPLLVWQFYLAMSLVLVVATLKQRKEIINGESAGVVECKIITFRIYGNIFWFIYSLIAGRWAVVIAAFANFLALWYTRKTWKKYKK